MEQEQHYEPLVGFEDTYEMCIEYPYYIRRIGSNKDISFNTKCSKGYIQVKLNGYPYRLHRLIAEQFIENEDPIHKTEVDHINHNRTDNHIENLRWCTHATNNRNRTMYKGYEATYIPYEDIPDDIIAVTKYGKHVLEHIIYSFSTDTFYYDTNEAYHVLPVRYQHSSPYVHTIDVDNNQIRIYINKFKYDNGIQ